jgi:hypothetical protein
MFLREHFVAAVLYIHLYRLPAIGWEEFHAQFRFFFI